MRAKHSTGMSGSIFSVEMSRTSLDLMISGATAEVLPQAVQEPDQRRGVQGAVPHLCHPQPRRGVREERAG